MNNDLHAKALRAAEWFRAHGWKYKFEEGIWEVSRGLHIIRGSDEILLEVAQSNGWQDTEPKTYDAIVGKLELTDEECAENEGVEWQQIVGDFRIFTNDKGQVLYLSTKNTPWTNGKWDWELVTECDGSQVDFGEASTRAKARRAALEAARGLG